MGTRKDSFVGRLKKRLRRTTPPEEQPTSKILVPPPPLEAGTTNPGFQTTSEEAAETYQPPKKEEVALPPPPTPQKPAAPSILEETLNGDASTPVEIDRNTLPGAQVAPKQTPPKEANGETDNGTTVSNDEEADNDTTDKKTDANATVTKVEDCVVFYAHQEKATGAEGYIATNEGVLLAEIYLKQKNVQVEITSDSKKAEELWKEPHVRAFFIEAYRGKDGEIDYSATLKKFLADRKEGRIPVFPVCVHYENNKVLEERAAKMDSQIVRTNKVLLRHSASIHIEQFLDDIVKGVVYF